MSAPRLFPADEPASGTFAGEGWLDSTPGQLMVCTPWRQSEYLLAWILRMLNQIIQVGLCVIFALVVLMVLVNSFYMIFSPASWFALPSWLRLQGVLTIERYGKGWGAIQIRVLGAIILATICWVGFDMLR
jgi:hypothetical protein